MFLTTSRGFFHGNFLGSHNHPTHHSTDLFLTNEIFSKIITTEPVIAPKLVFFVEEFSAAPLSYTARLCTFRIHHIRFYTLSITYAPFTTHFNCHSSRYYTPRLPTFRLCTFGHPHLPFYTLLFRHTAIVHNAFTIHRDSTQPIHHIPFLHSSYSHVYVHVNSIDTTRTSISHG